MAFRDFSADHREKRLRRCNVGLGSDKAFAHLLEKSCKLRAGFGGEIAFCHFEHGFLLLICAAPNEPR